MYDHSAGYIGLRGSISADIDFGLPDPMDQGA
jgi:hypothetical protein